jgi:hypothetical protein
MVWAARLWRERGKLERETGSKLCVLLGLGSIRTTVYIQCSNLRRLLEIKSRRGSGFCASPTMAFARPERALASTIDPKLGSKVVRGKTARPAACQSTSTTFQPLPRRCNDLQKARVGEASLSAQPAGFRHNAVDAGKRPLTIASRNARQIPLNHLAPDPKC